MRELNRNTPHGCVGEEAMRKYSEFGRLFKKGVDIVIAHQEWEGKFARAEITRKLECEESQYYKYRRGEAILKDPNLTKEFIKYCLHRGKLESAWGKRLWKRCRMAHPMLNWGELDLPDAQIEIDVSEPTLFQWIERATDKLAYATLSNPPFTMTIKGARQMGKSTLLETLQHVAQQQHIQFVTLHPGLWTFHQGDDAACETHFFRLFARELSRKLHVPDKTDAYWNQPLPNTLRCTDYVEDIILPQVKTPMVLALDNADDVFDTPFRKAFFAMLRVWHDKRAVELAWRKLSLIVVTSTEPYAFIDDLTQSPFNVGERIELSDFSAEQIIKLNQHHNTPFTNDELDKLIALVGGHPYLITRAFDSLRIMGKTPANLFVRAIFPDGPFADHLAQVVKRVCDKPRLLAALCQIIQKQQCDDTIAIFELKGAGVVQQRGRAIVIRCQLYIDYIDAFYGCS